MKIFVTALGTGLLLDGVVKAGLPWFRGAHAEGDGLTFVEPDKTLIFEDAVQSKVVRDNHGAGGRPVSWIAVPDRVAQLAADLKTKHLDGPATSVAGFVKRMHAE